MTEPLLEKEDEYCINPKWIEYPSGSKIIDPEWIYCNKNDWQMCRLMVGSFLILFGFFLAILGGVLDFKIECDVNGTCILYPFTHRFYIMYASGICIMCVGFYKI